MWDAVTFKIEGKKADKAVFSGIDATVVFPCPLGPGQKNLSEVALAQSNKAAYRLM